MTAQSLSRCDDGAGPIGKAVALSDCKRRGKQWQVHVLHWKSGPDLDQCRSDVVWQPVLGANQRCLDVEFLRYLDG